MSDEKFKILGDVRVGSLDKTMQAEWERLHQVEEKIENLREEHGRALDAFWDAVQRQYHHFLDTQSPVTQNFSISTTGDVFVESCDCPLCQAVLHKLSVTQTVEKMYASALIPHDQIEALRARAKRIDAGQKKCDSLLN